MLLKRPRRAAFLAAAITGVILFVLVSLGQRLRDRIYDAYAAEWVSGLIIAHLQTHDDQWPDGWDDLAAQLAAHRRRHGGWSLEDLQRRVVVDFDIDAATFADNPSAAVRLRTGRQIHLENWEPNETIARYLRERAATRPAHGPMERASTRTTRSTP